jgi:ABC-2 type transport system ATP-binding protein
MEPVIKVKDLVQKSRKKVIFNGLNLEVFRGELFGLFGPRGAGKTTLLHILAGIERFSSGHVEVFGQDIRRGEGFKKNLGLVTQQPSLFEDLNAAENLDFIATLKGCSTASAADLIRSLHLQDFLNEPLHNLKPGPYQRLALACALLNKPSLLIADELINCLDPFSNAVIAKELSVFLAGGGTCIWAFNNISLCTSMNRVGWLEDGKLSIYQPEEACRVWDQQLLQSNHKPGEDHV